MNIGQTNLAPLPNGAGQIREYWIQVDSFPRNVVPNGRDDLTGNTYAVPAGTTYNALGYRGYSQDWKDVLPADSEIGQNDGIPGPTIRARPGDTIVLHFRNNDTSHYTAHSVHAHGLIHVAKEDGMYDNSNIGVAGAAVLPGEEFTYRFKVPENAVGSWLYYDDSMPERYSGKPFRFGPSLNSTVSAARPGESDDSYKPMAGQMGLFGLILIEDPHAPPPDRENIVFLHDLYQEDIAVLTQDFDCINGSSFISNTPTFHARVGERVRWHVAAPGKENHVFHIHGHRWNSKGGFTDTLILGPFTTGTIEYIEDSPGRWLYHCHVTEHMMGGMAGLYVVS